MRGNSFHRLRAVPLPRRGRSGEKGTGNEQVLTKNGGKENGKYQYDGDDEKDERDAFR